MPPWELMHGLTPFCSLSARNDDVETVSADSLRSEGMALGLLILFRCLPDNFSFTPRHCARQTRPQFSVSALPELGNVGWV